MLEVLKSTTEAKVAERVKRTAAAVSAWAVGLCVPSYAPRVVLQREFGIDPSLWDESV